MSAGIGLTSAHICRYSIPVRRMTSMDGQRPHDVSSGTTEDSPEILEGYVRRAPRFGRFIGLGAVLGVTAALIVTFTTETSGSALTVAFVLAAYFGMAGIALGGLVGLLLDWHSTRGIDRVKRAKAEKTHRDNPVD